MVGSATRRFALCPHQAFCGGITAHSVNTYSIQCDATLSLACTGEQFRHKFYCCNATDIYFYVPVRNMEETVRSVERYYKCLCVNDPMACGLSGYWTFQINWIFSFTPTGAVPSGIIITAQITITK